VAVVKKGIKKKEKIGRRNLGLGACVLCTNI
jgi:hypothetical protein